MRTRSAVVAVALLATAAPASAHRLDEYLQATTVAVEEGRVTLRLRMTPGVGVARGLIARIDADGDGAIADAERRAYVEWIRRDTSASIDGIPLGLRAASTSFPGVEELSEGLGSILVEFEADMPPGGPARRLAIENRHQGAIAVYLVNCLRPGDPKVRILSQARNEGQSSYRLEFALDGATRGRLATSSGARRGPDMAAASAVLETYFSRGVRHILAGYDHLLFIGVLALGAATFWELAKVVTAFTLAHSITLTLAALDLVHLPGRVVEPAIAASIVFVAAQNLLRPASSGGRGRLAAAFFFGLFHGLGFAGGLVDVMRGLPTGTVVPALLGFCSGVEAGHQVVLLPLFGILKAACRLRRDPGDRDGPTAALRRIGSAGILVAGAYYVCAALIGSP